MVALVRPFYLVPSRTLVAGYPDNHFPFVTKNHSPSMRKAAFFTLGCRLNQTESSIMAKSLENEGYMITQEKEGLDLAVINTCTVTNQSDAKCRQTIRSIQKKNPEAMIAVVGCFSQVASQQILDIGGVDLVLGNEEKLNLYKYIAQAQASSVPVVSVEKISRKPFTIDTIGQHLGVTRANLKIQDGCSFVCSFCIIPFARGTSRSREVENIRQETQALADMGVKEIILTGVNIGTYQHQDTNFLSLLDLFEKVDGIERVRISSIEPTTVGREIFQRMADPSSKLVPYLHLPLQSANNEILRLMRRKYLIEEYEDFVLQAMEQIPRLCIGSDLIVGFPGESDDCFADTFETLQRLPVHYFHVFPYAERQGTQSVKLPNQVPPPIATRRAASLRELSNQKKETYTKQFIGQELSVLFEGNQGGTQWHGYTDNYIRVAVDSNQTLKNEIRQVRLSSQKSGIAQGELIN